MFSNIYCEPVTYSPLINEVCECVCVYVSWNVKDTDGKQTSKNPKVRRKVDFGAGNFMDSRFYI